MGRERQRQTRGERNFKKHFNRQAMDCSYHNNIPVREGKKSETEVGREGGRERKGDCERAREILNNTLIDRQ